MAKLRNPSTHSQAALHKAMQSATSKLPVAPPPTDMSMILSSLAKGGNTADTHTPVGAFLRVLRGRFGCKHPIVVLKSCLLVHAVIRAGNDALVRYLSKHHGGLLDATVKGETREALFLRAYAPYVKHWLAVRERCTWFARGMSGAVPEIWERMTLDKTMDEIEGILDVLQKGGDINGAGEMDVIRVCLTMILHDCWKLAEMLGQGVDRMVQHVPTCGYTTAGRALEVYRRVVEVGARMARRAEEWEWVEGRWKVAELLRFDARIGDDIQQYIEEGCVGARPWLRAARRLAAGEMCADAMRDITKVVQGEQVDEEETNETIRVLVGGIATGDWRVGLRCVGALAALAETDRGDVVEELMHRGRQGELGVGDIDTSVMHWETGGERLRWGLGYLERLVGWKVVRQESKGKGFVGVVEEVEMLVEILKWLKQDLDCTDPHQVDVLDSVRRMRPQLRAQLACRGRETADQFWDVEDADDLERGVDAVESMGDVDDEADMRGIVADMRKWVEQCRCAQEDGIEKRML